jgi:hypothetical protein
MNIAFWKWWTSFVLILASLAMGEYYLELSHYLLVADSTKISLGILLLFLLNSLYVGYLSYIVQFEEDPWFGINTSLLSFILYSFPMQ